MKTRLSSQQVEIQTNAQNMVVGLTANVADLPSPPVIGTTDNVTVGSNMVMSRKITTTFALMSTREDGLAGSRCSGRIVNQRCRVTSSS